MLRIVFVLAASLGCVVPAGAATQRLAQLTLPSTAPAASGVTRQGAYLLAPIELDGATLFQIAAKSTMQPGQLPIAVRASDVNSTLQQLIATTGSGANAMTVFDPRTIRVHVRHAGDLDSLEVVDAKHSDPLPIVTVTPLDAEYNQTTIDSLATQWQTTLQSALTRALDVRQPAVRRSNAGRVIRVGAILAVASLLLWALYASLRRRIAALQETIDARERVTEAEQQRVAAEADDAHRRRRRFLALALRNIEPTRRRAIYIAGAEAILWGTALAWFTFVTWAFALFPQTSPLAQQIVHGALAIVITVVVTGLLNRILDVVIARIAGVWRMRSFVNSEDRARLLLRIPTIARAIAGLKTFVLVFIAVLSVVGALGVPIGSVVTVGGLAAVALSLAAQNIVRDFLNGFLVLLEDQYVIGDFVTINASSGLVERLTLRMVQVRDAQGDLSTIPHSSVTSVVNGSRNWSRVDYRVPVDPASDVPRAIELVRSAIQTLAAEEAWRESVVDPIEWIGIDALSKDWAVVRASVKTLPLRQFELRRLINERVCAAFTQAGIAFGAQIPGVS